MAELLTITQRGEPNSGVYDAPLGLLVVNGENGWYLTPNSGAFGSVTLDAEAHGSRTESLAAADRFVAWLTVPLHTPHAKLSKIGKARWAYEPWGMALTAHPHPYYRATSVFTGTVTTEDGGFHLYLPSLTSFRAFLAHVHEQAAAL